MPVKHRVGGPAIGLVLVMALAVGACGGSEAKDTSLDNAASGGKATSTTQASGSGSGSGSEAGSKPSTGSAQGSSKSTKSTTTTVAGKGGTTSTTEWDVEKTKTLEISAELKESCVRPGGSQTITIRSERGSGVGYDAVYADGKGGAMEGHYGGNKGGQVDKDGTFTDTWVVAPHAPAGRVTVNVLGAKAGGGKPMEHNEIVVYFTVSDALGRCA